MKSPYWSDQKEEEEVEEVEEQNNEQSDSEEEDSEVTSSIYFITIRSLKKKQKPSPFMTPTKNTYKRNTTTPSPIAPRLQMPRDEDEKKDVTPSKVKAETPSKK